MNSITTIQTLATSKKLFRHSSNNGIYICRSFKLRFEGPCCTHSEVPRSCIQSKDGIHLTLFPWLIILPSQETVLFFTRFIHREKVPGGDGDTWVMELAERALDETFKVKLQAFINEVCCLTLYTHSGFLWGILGIIPAFFLCAFMLCFSSPCLAFVEIWEIIWGLAVT